MDEPNLTNTPNTSNYEVGPTVISQTLNREELSCLFEDKNLLNDLESSVNVSLRSILAEACGNLQDFSDALLHPSRKYVYRCFNDAELQIQEMRQNLTKFGNNRNMQVEKSFWYDIGYIWFDHIEPKPGITYSCVAIYDNNETLFEQDTTYMSFDFSTEEGINALHKLRQSLIGVIEIEWV